MLPDIEWISENNCYNINCPEHGFICAIDEYGMIKEFEVALNIVVKHYMEVSHG